MIGAHSIRARLVATYTVVAMLAAVVGLVLFSVLLRRGVTASVDASLRARAAPLIASVNTDPNVAVPTSGGPGVDRPDRPGRPPAVDAFTAVYRTDGRVARVQPAELGTSPLSGSQVDMARTHTRHLVVTVGDERVRVLATPVRTSAGIWVVAAGTSLAPFTGAANEAIHELEVAIPFLILLAAFGAWLLSGSALRPVERMRADADALGEHDPANRLSVPGTAELAHLAETFNALLDRLHRSLARQHDLIADAGHELRTPLAVLRIELELADGAHASREELADAVAHARHEVDRLSRLAEDLLFLARADSASPLVRPQRTDASVVVADSIRAHRAHATSRGIDITLDAPVPCPAQADPSALRRALDNLVANALDASSPGGTIHLDATSTADGLTITVADSGPGFPKPFLDHAFERFARPGGARASNLGGAGLGLAIVAEIARAHHGSVVAANTDGGGATVTITLPAREEVAPGVGPGRTVPRRGGGGRRS